MNKPSLAFAFQFQGDGSSPTVQISLATGPIFFTTFNPSYPILSTELSALPSGVSGVAAPGLTVNSATVSLGVLTVTFAAAPANGTIYEVVGNLEF